MLPSIFIQNCPVPWPWSPIIMATISMTFILPGTSPQKLMQAHAKDDTEIADIRAFPILCDQEEFQHPVRQKVVKLPANNGHRWGGRGRITLVGDSAHGSYTASKEGVRGT
jgi:hypothetical protein